MGRSFLWLKYGGILDWSSVWQRKWKNCWDHIVIPGFEYLNEEDNNNIEMFKETLTEEERSQFEEYLEYTKLDKAGQRKFVWEMYLGKVGVTEEEYKMADKLGRKEIFSKMLKLLLDDGEITKNESKYLMNTYLMTARK